MTDWLTQALMLLSLLLLARIPNDDVVSVLLLLYLLSLVKIIRNTNKTSFINSSKYQHHAIHTPSLFYAHSTYVRTSMPTIQACSALSLLLSHSPPSPLFILCIQNFPFFHLPFGLNTISRNFEYHLFRKKPLLHFMVEDSLKLLPCVCTMTLLLPAAAAATTTKHFVPLLLVLLVLYFSFQFFYLSYFLGSK